MKMILIGFLVCCRTKNAPVHIMKAYWHSILVTYIPAWVTDPSSLEEKNSLLKSFTLYQNYPNPFNASTKIVYDLGKPADVKISIYNIKGQLQDSYLIKNKSAGKHYFSLNVPDYASGIYYYQVEANSLRKTGKMILIK